MVSKRYQQGPVSQPNTHTQEQDKSERPGPAPRRSGRIQKRETDAVQADAAPARDESLHTTLVPPRGKKRMSSVVGNMAGALPGLRRMEDDFRNAVKRQKLALSDSSVTSSGKIEAEDAALLSKPHRPNPDCIPAELEVRGLQNKKTRKSMMDDDNNGEEAYEDGEPGDREEGGIPVDDVDANGIKQEGGRPPPVNSEYLPLPWRGRLGYACLNTYLRTSNPAVFSSRTCRISSILDHRHPLRDPSQPEHSTKNRPDKEQPADIARGRKYVEALGLANARDIVKMLRWNDKYGIKFMRLSSEMFPFASHEEYGYKLAPFASETLAEAGKVAAELGHRLTTHPGQFTQLGSPREEVVRNAIRDLEYHDEMLTLLRLPKQQDKDAVMILHMGGVFGDKGATLDRFRKNYAKLSPSVKARLVLENDDVSWTVHDLLPICEELNIPHVLDFHHHNIMFDRSQMREGTKDVEALYPRIRATWARKGITMKMHYSEPCASAVTPRQRRKHRPRVMTLPPCPDDVDLMIEAKDKEQAVFDLMRNFRLPGWDTFNDVVPHEREDENRPAPPVTKKKQQQQRKKAMSKKKAAAGVDDNAGEEGKEDDAEEELKQPPPVPEEEVGMGGPDNRVYWPLGMEEWLRPKKREVKEKKKTGDEAEEDD
ncbi:UV-endonuclease UvdE [Hypoxylon sp. FL1284]|nr:UV-endonuclease UvdE [Hypoxylon sp. FL1284]